MTVQQTCEYLKAQNQILILCHQSPDGDTLGSGFGLYYALWAMGKQVRVACSDPIPPQFSFLLPQQMPDFAPQCVATCLLYTSFEALTLLEKEKGIPADYLLEKIKAAIAIAVKRDYGGSENGLVEIDPEKGKFQVAIRKTVVEAVENPNTEILLNDAYKYDKKAEIGSVVDIPLETKQFGRIAAQAAKHVIRQGIREAERGQMMQEFQSREHEIISAKVVRTDPVRGSVKMCIRDRLSSL